MNKEQIEWVNYKIDKLRTSIQILYTQGNITENTKLELYEYLLTIESAVHQAETKDVK